MRLLPSPRGQDRGTGDMQLIGVDVGGTFTDLIFTDTDRDVTLIHKVPTTPDDPSVGAIAGLRELCARHDLDPAAIDPRLPRHHHRDQRRARA